MEKVISTASHGSITPKPGRSPVTLTCKVPGAATPDCLILSHSNRARHRSTEFSLPFLGSYCVADGKTQTLNLFIWLDCQGRNRQPFIIFTSFLLAKNPSFFPRSLSQSVHFFLHLCTMHKMARLLLIRSRRTLAFVRCLC